MNTAPIEASLSPPTTDIPAEVTHPTSLDDIDDALLLQYMILDQQCKGVTGYIPKVPETARRPARLDGTIGNMFMTGHEGLTCNDCVDAMFSADRALWPDLKRHIHVPLPVGLRIGPDVHQCFCGYFSFLVEDVERHLEGVVEMGVDGSGVMKGLVRRIERVEMHEACRENLVGLIGGEEQAQHVSVSAGGLQTT